MAFVQAKPGWEWTRKRKKKITPLSSYQTRNRKFQKNSKKVYKIKKHHCCFFPSQNK